MAHQSRISCSTRGTRCPGPNRTHAAAAVHEFGEVFLAASRMDHFQVILHGVEIGAPRSSIAQFRMCLVWPGDVEASGRRFDDVAMWLIQTCCVPARARGYMAFIGVVQLQRG